MRADAELLLPAPGLMIHVSPAFNPPILKGLKVYTDNPLKLEFILDKGDSESSLKAESTKLIKYFLAALTIPEKDLWVNLSPYEKNRIIPDAFGQTEMGRDLLAQDYMLKQITASLIYPEDEVGKKFWNRIYKEAAKKFGTTNIPINTFNKVWIIPEKAVVYENAKAGTAYVVESKLKVMLEEDYLALSKQIVPCHGGATEIIRDLIIPELTKEINQGKNFAQLRQVYNSLILATWYKKKIKTSILSQVYADKNKIEGINLHNPQLTPTQIYNQYLQAFKKGVYNYVKEEQDPLTKQAVPRKYFSGGANFLTINAAMVVQNRVFWLQKIKDSLKHPTNFLVLAITLQMISSVSKAQLANTDRINFIYGRHVWAYHQILGAYLSGEIPPNTPLILFDQHSDNHPIFGDEPGDADWLTHLKYQEAIGDSFWMHPKGAEVLLGDKGFFKARGYEFESMIESHIESFRNGVILSFDLDYFAATGTGGNASYLPQQGEIAVKIKYVFDILRKHNIPVLLVNAAYSTPKYAPEKFKAEFEEALLRESPTEEARLISRAQVVQDMKKGGIDLTTDKVLRIKNSGENIKFHFDSAQLHQLQNAQGFAPLIEVMAPLGNVVEFLSGGN